MSNWSKVLVVTVGAILLSVLGLQASDTLRGLDTSLSGLVSESGGPCGNGAVQFLLGSYAICVDKFEASPDEACPKINPTSQVDTQSNLNEGACKAVSEPEKTPWRFISLTQAQQMCARDGKRLPNNEEWYKFASGLTDQENCVLSGNNSPAPTGSADCITPAGIHDVVGNLWEWVDEEVVNGSYNSRQLPDSGYVSLVDSDGVVVETSAAAQAEFSNDYAWTKPDGVYGIIRGGFYGSQDDGGIFAQNLAVPFDFKTAGVGFRCVRDI